MKIFLLIITSLMLAWGISHHATAQSDCSVKIRSNFDSECIITGYPYKPIKATLLSQMVPLYNYERLGLNCVKACNGNAVFYDAVCDNAVVYTWTVSGAEDYYHQGGDSSRLIVIWGNGASGTVAVNVVTSDNNTCSDEICVQLINSPQAGSTTIPDYYLNAGGNKMIEICLGESIAFLDASTAGGTPITGHYWESIYGEAASLNHVITPTQTGGFSVIHTVYNECGCESTEEYKVEVMENSQPLHLSCYGTVCAGSIQSYEAYTPHCNPYYWRVEGGTIVGGQGTETITVQWENPESGYGTISLDATYCEGECRALTSVKIPVISDNMQIRGSGDICVGEHQLYELPLWGSTAYRWNITPISGFELFNYENANQLLVKFNTPGIYTLTANYDCEFIDCGIFQAISKIITVKDLLEISSSDNGKLCQGDTVTFSTNYSGSVFWEILDSTNTVIFTQTSNSLNFSFTGHGTFQITATHPNYCNTAEYHITISATPPQLSNISGQHVVCLGNSVALSAVPSHPDYYIYWEPLCSSINPVEGDVANFTFINEVCSVNVYQIDRENGCRSQATLYEITQFFLIPMPDTVITTCAGSTVHIDFLDQSNVMFEWFVSPANAASVIDDHSLGSVDIYMNYLTGQISPLYPVTVEVKRIFCNNEEIIQTFLLSVTDVQIPVISFDDTACVGESLFFTATGATTSDSHYQWLIDGQIFMGRNVNASFSSSGLQTVTLFYTPEAGCETIEVRGQIFIQALPAALITVYLDGSDTTYLAVTQQLNGSYQWYKNNQLVSGATTTTLLSTGPGNYCCDVTSMQTGCAHRGCYSISSDPGTDSTVICQPIPLSISSSSCNIYTLDATTSISPATLHWSSTPSAAGNFISPSTSTPSATVEFPQPGYFYVNVSGIQGGECYYGRVEIVINCIPEFSLSHSCSNQLTVTDNSQYLADYSVTGRSVTVEVAATDFSQTLTLTACSIPPCSTELLFTIPDFTEVTTATVTMVNGACTLVKTKTIYPVPVINAVSVPDRICAGTPFQASSDNVGVTEYHWNFGDNSSAMGATPYHTYSESGTTPFQITLTGTNPVGCTATSTPAGITVFSNSLSGSFNIIPLNTVLCQGEIRRIIYSVPNLYYIWTPANPDLPPQIYNARSSGDYTLRATNSNGCIQQLRQNLTFKNRPVAKITGQTVYCEGDTVKLLGNSGTSNVYVWTVIHGSQTFYYFDPNIKFKPTVAGFYTITLEVYGADCSATDNITIEIKARPNNPVLSIAGNQCMGEPPVQLTSNLGLPLYWSNGFYGVTALYYVPGWATAYYVDFSSGCFSEKDSILIEPAPDYDALLTGCHQICHNDFTATLSVYSFSPTEFSPTWIWYYNGNNIAGGSDTYPQLPLPGQGSYYLEVSYASGCNSQSPELIIETKEMCGCEKIAVQTLEAICKIEECNLYYDVTVKICNYNANPFYVTQFYTNSSQVIIDWNPNSLTIQPQSCETFNFTILITDFSSGMTEFILFDEENQCEKKFSINMDWDSCINTECEMQFFKHDFNTNLSTPHQTSYFDFWVELPLATIHLLSIWSEPPHIVNYSYAPPTIVNGLLMFSYGELIQMAANEENICIHAIVCIEGGELCHVIHCIPANMFLYQIPENFRRLVSSNSETDDKSIGKQQSIETAQPKPYLVPNPSKLQVTVLGIEQAKIKEITILSLNGQHVSKFNNTNQFNVEKIAPATYIIRVTTTENNVHYLKLIKE